MTKAYVSVYLLDVIYTIDKEYTYFLPEEYRNAVTVGSLLVVPFGRSNKQVSAVVSAFPEDPSYQGIKSVIRILDYPLDIPEEMVHIGKFIKERFFCSFGQAFRAMLPPGINLSTETYYEVTSQELPEDLCGAEYSVYNVIREKEDPSFKVLQENFDDRLSEILITLQKKGLVQSKTRVERIINEKSVTSLRLIPSPEEIADLLDEGSTLTPKQKTLVELLTHYPSATMREVSEIGGISPAVVSGLVRKHIVERFEIRVQREPTYGHHYPDPPQFQLSEEQENARKTLCQLADSHTAQAALLYGVTGSGKTKVIIETAKHILSQGKSIIILLPEIGLTAQATGIYYAIFGKQMTVIHSMLSVGERLDAFRAMREGRIRVVLGTRTAVFSPLNNLGLIVIDEEQEGTYKSEITPKYHARDVARFRCHENNALLVMASATPSIESFFKAQNGKYTLIRLPSRYGKAELPHVEIEDLRNDSRTFPDHLIGTRLDEELRNTLSHQRQSILFVNRRGYQSHISCRKCGKVYVCPYCSVSLTYHAYEGNQRVAGKLSCHYCGYTEPVPKRCNSCGSDHIGYFGFGTQKLQEELEETLPEARVLRMDADTTQTKNSHDKILETFGRGDADILSGTQMVSKGLDFPRVDLVGVISVDSSLYQNDFRAGERTFSLITQLVGRAGRSDHKGIAILQTYNPDNEILRLAAKQDYEAFYQSEILLRKAVSFPPFCSVLVFTIASPNETACEKFSSWFSSMMEEEQNREWSDVVAQKFGPYPNGIYKIGGKFRQRIIMKYSDTARSRLFFAEMYRKGLTKCTTEIHLDADANPVVI